MKQLTLLRRQSALSSPHAQRSILEGTEFGELATFEAVVQSAGVMPLCSRSVRVMQINVGKVCNQTCSHCHVDAGPDRKESMSRATAELVIEVLAQHQEIETLDITGGAPEMNPNFRWLVEQARALGKRVIDRCNLTILMANGFRDLPQFLADHQVEVVASLPCYLEENCDRQRGDGVFQRSIAALRELNGVGYGKPGSGLVLNLVYNPVGASLPPEQGKLEEAYRQQLRERFAIEFNALHTITNLPISRFLDDLIENDRYEAYIQLLIQSFNPHTLSGVMCRDMISVDWEGNLYDCDFNQMLALPVVSEASSNLRDFQMASLKSRTIMTGRHCFGCTAGAGSSCQGALVRDVDGSSGAS